VLVPALLFATAGSASYGVAGSVTSATVRVTAGGEAEVIWRAGGSERVFSVPRSGRGHYLARPTRDVSKPAPVAVPMAVAVRRTADGTLWALQRVAVAGRPTSLDLARWNGAPTRLTLARDGDRLTGRATFQGRPVTGFSETLAGKHIRIHVFLECYGCAGARGKWSLMLGVAPKPDGSFAIRLRPAWIGSRYRATVSGPNLGGQLAPAARVVIRAAD
jgi:hypothetical protein